MSNVHFKDTGVLFVVHLIAVFEVRVLERRNALSWAGNVSVKSQSGSVSLLESICPIKRNEWGNVVLWTANVKPIDNIFIH